MTSPVIDDVYELVAVQTLLEQEVLNTYFYQVRNTFVTTDPTPAQVLAENWVDQILPDICVEQASILTYTQVRVRNLFNEADAFTLPISVPGGNDAGGTPEIGNTFDAFAFELQGETHSVRAGAKRLAGVLENASIDGVITDTGTLTRLTAAADAMERAVQVGLVIMDDVFFPVLVKRIRTGSPGNYTYSLPASSGELIQTTILNVLLKVLVTSQVSRKVGVGV